MNLTKLTLSYIRRRKLNTLLNTLLLALGIATIVVLLLFGQQFESSMTRNARGIDAVVGAKGSPMQLILSGIYHLDVPTGNIPMTEAKAIAQHRAVKQAIPLALGDSYLGYRIVGTEHSYVEHYEAGIAEGGLWQQELEVTVGAAVAREQKLAVGDEIVSSHGLGSRGDDHGDHPLRITGILAPSGTVLDRLILTSIETVWHVHGQYAGEAEAHTEAASHDDHADDGAGALNGQRNASPWWERAPDDSDITALLIAYSSPMAAAMFPRFINTQTPLQAASPAFETARLFSLLGVGVDAVRAFGLILIVAAALGLFIALYNALKERRYDLAIMRTLGASRAKLLWHVLLEGLVLAFLGTALGIALGHTATSLLGSWLRQAQQLDLTGWSWAPGEGWILLLAVAIGVIAAIIPAIQAYRTDIARILAER